MDLKPVSRPTPQPTNVVNPGAPTPPTVEDPFKSDPPVLPPVQKKRRGGKAKKFLMVLLLLVLIAGVGYGVYYWQHQQVDKLAKENAALSSELAASKAKVSELQSASQEATTEPTADELVITSVTNYCQAGVDPTTKKALVYTQGTSGTDKKKVLYSTDKNFAYVNAACTETAAKAEGNYRGYYLKLSDGQWVVLYSGQEADPVATKTYNIPAFTDFK